VDVLRIAAGDGRLTAEELDERLEAALSARTLGELAAVISDLPARPVVAAEQAKDVLRIDQRGGSVQLTGRWVVPRRLELRSAWCDVTLDFTDAVITYDTLPIEMNVRGGSLILVAGPGIAIDADDLTARYTDLGIGPAARHDAPDVLRVRLTGRVRYGRIETRLPGPAPGHD
jgi:Domain of unknown function (DUF1707)